MEQAKNGVRYQFLAGTLSWISRIYFVTVVCVALLSGLPLIAQQYNEASLAGTVQDTSGAVVPEATVTIENTGIGLVRTMTASSEGTFLFPSLPVGSYKLTVQKTGFTTYIQTGITLTVNEAANVIVTLRVGTVSQQVTVNASAELIPARESTVGQLIGQERVVELPLDGRNAADLVFLSAGAINVTGNYCDFNCFGGVYPTEEHAVVSGNGALGVGSVYYTLDGSAHNDTYLNMNLPFPNPDALQEYKLQENNLSAVYGGSGSGVVNIVTKSGTNQIHGSIFEFVRNGDLNARNFFAPTQDTLKRNQFGGGIGGPIVKDKLFYFVSYQGTRVVQTLTGNVAFVPTLAERSGDFSALSTQLINPVTGVPFAGNLITPSPVSLYFLNHIPLPNGPNGELTYPGATLRPFQDEGTVKIDYLRGKQRVSGRYYVTDYRQAPGVPPSTNILEASSQGALVRVNSLSGDYSNALSSRVLVEGNIGYNRQMGGTLSSAPFSYADAGAAITPSSEAPGEINLTVPGYFVIQTNHPGAFNRQDLNVRGRVAITHGGHQLQFGMDATHLANQITNTFTQAGIIGFSSALTGNNLADFVLGDMSSWWQGGGEFKDLVGWRWGWFAQDDWRVSERLTFNLGARWDPYIPYTEREGRFTCFQPGIQSIRYPNAPAGETFGAGGGEPGDPSCYIPHELNTFAPRLGFAYKLTKDSKTALRGGVGYYYIAPSQDVQTSHYDAPFAPNFRYSGIISFQDPWASVGTPNPFPARFGGTTTPPRDVTFTIPESLQVSGPDIKVPLMTTWNLTLERELANGWLLRVAYVGNKGTNLATFVGLGNLNDLNPAIYIPGASTEANTQSRRRYPNFTTVQAGAQSGNNSHYNGLQVTIDRHFARGLSILANYTWSKTMDDFGWTDPFDRKFDYARSNDCIPQDFNFSGVWQLPKRPGTTGFVNHILNGWQLSPIISWRDGFPYLVFSGVDNSFSGHGFDRADFIGSSIKAAEIGFGESHGQQVNEFINTSLWVPNAIGTFGDSGRNNLAGPRFFDTDLALVKTTKINERSSVEFRAEFFNLFNNVNFYPPGTTGPSPQGGNALGTTLGTASFGKLTGAQDPRILQFALKFYF